MDKCVSQVAERFHVDRNRPSFFLTATVNVRDVGSTALTLKWITYSWLAVCLSSRETCLSDLQSALEPCYCECDVCFPAGQTQCHR